MQHSNEDQVEALKTLKDKQEAQYIKEVKPEQKSVKKCKSKSTRVSIRESTGVFRWVSELSGGWSLRQKRKKVHHIFLLCALEITPELCKKADAWVA